MSRLRLRVHVRTGRDRWQRSVYRCGRNGPRAELERHHVELAELKRDPRLLARVNCPDCRAPFLLTNENEGAACGTK